MRVIQLLYVAGSLYDVEIVIKIGQSVDKSHTLGQTPPQLLLARGQPHRVVLAYLLKVLGLFKFDVVSFQRQIFAGEVDYSEETAMAKVACVLPSLEQTYRCDRRTK